GWHPHGSRFPSFFLRQTRPVPIAPLRGGSRLCKWESGYLMAKPTCPNCDTQASPICLSNPAGTSWLDSLHADRWTT
ncbi:Male-specific protein scotti, partial [Dissostichus eleginoides]